MHRQESILAQILDNIPAQKAWVALGWRHFMYWFADAEFRLEHRIGFRTRFGDSRGCHLGSGRKFKT